MGQEKENQEPDREKIFKENWITTLMTNMEEQLDKDTRNTLMNSCGRACARRGAVKQMGEPFKGNVKGFVDNFAQYMGKEDNYLDGDTVHWCYKRCLCELVHEGPDRLPATYCECSKGWVMEMFELVAQKPVKVETLQTIKRGADSCKFIIRL